MGKGMDNNGFRSENTSGNRNNETRKAVTSKILGLIAKEQKEKKEAEEAANRRLVQGNGKYIINGSDDRVNGKIYDGDNNELYPTEDDKRSYHYGYIYHGGRRLFAIVEELIKEGKYEEVALIAERDYNHGLEKGHLGMVEKNSVYIEAFDKIASKGKLR